MSVDVSCPGIVHIETLLLESSVMMPQREVCLGKFVTVEVFPVFTGEEVPLKAAAR